jgi:hypothetical protein
MIIDNALAANLTNWQNTERREPSFSPFKINVFFLFLLKIKLVTLTFEIMLSFLVQTLFALQGAIKRTGSYSSHHLSGAHFPSSPFISVNAQPRDGFFASPNLQSEIIDQSETLVWLQERLCFIDEHTIELARRFPKIRTWSIVEQLKPTLDWLQSRIGLSEPSRRWSCRTVSMPVAMGRAISFKPQSEIPSDLLTTLDTVLDVGLSEENPITSNKKKKKQKLAPGAASVNEERVLSFPQPNENSVKAQQMMSAHI